jgi:hypothetical protein
MRAAGGGGKVPARSEEKIKTANNPNGPW